MATRLVAQPVLGLVHHAVFLDRASLPAPMRPPLGVERYEEFDTTAAADVVERLSRASIAITNKVPLRAGAFAALPALRLIAVAATGYDCIDVAACRTRGIAVCNVRDYAIHTVPEHVFMLVLALRRNLLAYVADVTAGRWQDSPQFCLRSHPIRDLHGATLGIIGAGALGQATAALATGFGMQVIYAGHAAARAPVTRVALQELLSRADVVSLHCPLTPATRHLIGRDQLRAMQPHALLINTARGGIVDEQALVEALEAGWIGGAGFDVLSEEPPRTEQPLLALRRPNFILTPHVAWSSDAALHAVAAQLVENIELWVAGRPRHLVT